MGRAQSLTIRPGRLDDEALREYAALKRSKSETSAGLADVAEQLRGSEFFDVFLEGKRVGRYAVRVNRWAHGVEAEITGAVGQVCSVNGARDVLPVIERLQLVGADVVKIETRRKALIARLMRQGYQVCSVNLRKRLK